MTSPSAVPPTAHQMADFYDALGPLLRMSWSDNFHLGYWEGPGDGSSPQEATDRFTDLLVSRLGVGAGDVVLDAGCGIGSPALRLASLTGARVVGITISRQQVEQARELAREAGMAERVEFRYADAMDTPFEAESFDAVLAFESIVHMERPTALREMARVLKPGGRLVLTDVFQPQPQEEEATDAGPFDPAFATIREEDSPDMTSFVRLDDWPGLVSDAGLVLDELTDVTRNVEQTFARMLDGFLDHRREFESRYGVRLEQVLDSAKLSAQPNPASVGCLVMAATKP
ncbi:SAM-dependent methyltransferase [Streptomyces sp. NPDC087844]|uniref:SAM-dependent methyltransferase n=1 Tax=Streptomyces sp. NPDC087844 TaxID=3365805 RepID=UPI003819202F